MDFSFTQASNFLNGIKDESFADDINQIIETFLSVENIYLSATREIATKLEILNDEFRYSMNRNPIHHIETRVKTPKSIIDKMKKKGYDLSFGSATENLNDIAGVRVICSYIDDIYMIAQLLSSQDDVDLLMTTDYIKNPKPNGYRSLHLIVTVPVFLSKSTQRVKAEIQIRTIAMDFWASLERDIAYKVDNEANPDISKELKSCAEVIASTDLRMQNLYNKMRELK